MSLSIRNALTQRIKSETQQNTTQQTTPQPVKATPVKQPTTQPVKPRVRTTQQEGTTNIRRAITMMMSLMASIVGLYTVVYAMQVVYSVPPAQLVGTPVAVSLG